MALLRRVIDGLTTEKGLRDTLVLLSVCETCKCKNVDFLDFLRSGSKDIDEFAMSRGSEACDHGIVLEGYQGQSHRFCDVYMSATLLSSADLTGHDRHVQANAKTIRPTENLIWLLFQGDALLALLKSR